MTGRPVEAKVLLADDDIALSTTLSDYLSNDGFAVTTVHDGASATRLALSGEYQLAVLDVMMPELHGIEALQRIRETSSLPIIILTARGGDADRILGLEVGADDYLAKPCMPRELAARIRAIMRRVQRPEHRPAVRVGGLAMWTERRHVELHGQPLALTSSQFNVLEVLLHHAGRIVSKRDICEQALGRPYARFDRSIDVHMSCLRAKLGPYRRLIHTVRKRGYQLEKE
jgi:two-component system, OmpR family, response regulator